LGLCGAPFKCSTKCAIASDIGQKDCAAGLCCMAEEGEIPKVQDFESFGNDMTKAQAVYVCYKKAKECFDDVLGYEIQLKNQCLDLYNLAPGITELLDFTEGMC